MMRHNKISITVTICVAVLILSACQNGSGFNQEDLIGTWESQGTFMIRFNADGSYEYVTDAKQWDLETEAGDFGDYHLEGTTLTVISGADTFLCAGLQGTYEVEVNEESVLHLTPIEDPCDMKSEDNLPLYNRGETFKNAPLTKSSLTHPPTPVVDKVETEEQETPTLAIDSVEPGEEKAPTPEYIEGMINLGDEIDGMLFTTDVEMDMFRTINAFCGWEPKERTEEVIEDIAYRTLDFECAASAGERFFFGNCVSLAEGFNTEDLDADWKKQKTEITFDDQGINFSSFGSLDFIGEQGGDARAWNVMVENITPGTHTLVCRRELPESIVETNWVVTVPSGTEKYPVLSTDVVPGQHPYTSEKAKFNYFLYIPDGYDIESEEKWPLILSLHGLEVGAMNSMDVLENIMFKPSDKLENFPFIILSPQGTQEYAEYEIWAADEIVSAVMTLLDEVQDKLAVDTNRIYLTGDSAGGNGAWVIGSRHPDSFAALVPVMGYYGWPFAVPDNICDLKDVPVWAFHGALDEDVPLDAEQMLVDALEACGGDVQFTVFPDIGHDIDHQQVYTEDLYEWLLEQTLE